MTATSSSNSYEQALKLAEAGQHEQALGLIQDHLLRNPRDGQALNDAGTLLYALGKFDQAAEHLKLAAANLKDEKLQALWNLAEVYLASDKPREAMGLFKDLAELEVMTPDLANRTANKFLELEDRCGAIEAILASLEVCPDQDVLVPMLEILRSQRARVTFFCDNGDTKFLKDIISHFTPRYQVKVYTGSTDAEMLEALQGCDIAFFEWCTEQVVRATSLPKVCKIVVRLHRYEAFRPWIAQVNWNNVDVLVTVGNSTVHRQLEKAVPDLRRRTRLEPIPNGVDLTKFNFIDRKKGKNLAVVGHINYWKNPMLLLQCFHRLHKLDKEYKLYFAGIYQDDGVLQQYVEQMIDELGLRGAVFFEGWQQDVAGWLQDKNYILVGSMVEGHPVNVLEAMARGLKPVIHTFPGCRDFFPPEMLYRTPEEFCDRILKDGYEPAQYRQFVAERFSQQQMFDRIDVLFRTFEQELRQGQGDSAAPNVLDETPVQRKRRQKIVQALAALGKSDLSILDFGCGCGKLDLHLAEFGAVTGIDPDEQALRVAREACPQGNFVHSGLLDAMLPCEAFDVAVSHDVLTAMPRQGRKAYLAMAADALRLGGLLVLTAGNAAVRDDGKGATEQELRTLACDVGFDVDLVTAFLDEAGKTGTELLLIARKAN